MLALFSAGLAGGVSHCAGMCGPFVLAQVGARVLPMKTPAASPSYGELARLRGAMLVPYHLGRATSYAALGALAALVAGGLAAFVQLPWIAAGLLLATAVVFLAAGLRGVVPGLAALPGIARAGAVLRAGESLARFTRPLWTAPLGWRGYGLGVALGFSPCGLVYGAVAAAGSTGSPTAAALGMLAFTAGTAPSLIAVGWLGALAANRFKDLARYVAVPLMLVNAAVLAHLAWRLVQ
ncbi:MAG: sulfite exporter TauE/SafE family protein [Alphaproteobacteria bacterium]|nr:sulfite exporter TauE/SafE family protein [Alphaproteobacteria bacterium]